MKLNVMVLMRNINIAEQFHSSQTNIKHQQRHRCPGDKQKKMFREHDKQLTDAQTNLSSFGGYDKADYTSASDILSRMVKSFVVCFLVLLLFIFK